MEASLTGSTLRVHEGMRVRVIFMTFPAYLWFKSQHNNVLSTKIVETGRQEEGYVLMGLSEEAQKAASHKRRKSATMPSLRRGYSQHEDALK